MTVMASFWILGILTCSARSLTSCLPKKARTRACPKQMPSAHSSARHVWNTRVCLDNCGIASASKRVRAGRTERVKTLADRSVPRATRAQSSTEEHFCLRTVQPASASPTRTDSFHPTTQCLLHGAFTASQSSLLPQNTSFCIFCYVAPSGAGPAINHHNTRTWTRDARQP